MHKQRPVPAGFRHRGCEEHRDEAVRYRLVSGSSRLRGVVLVSDQERAERRAQLDEVIEVIRPAVQADGGDLVVVSADVETGVVELELQGSCSSCAISTATLQG